MLIAYRLIAGKCFIFCKKATAQTPNPNITTPNPNPKPILDKPKPNPSQDKPIYNPDPDTPKPPTTTKPPVSESPDPVQDTPKPPLNDSPGYQTSPGFPAGCPHTNWQDCQKWLHNKNKKNIIDNIKLKNSATNINTKKTEFKQEASNTYVYASKTSSYYPA